MAAAIVHGDIPRCMAEQLNCTFRAASSLAILTALAIFNASSASCCNRLIGHDSWGLEEGALEGHLEGCQKAVDEMLE